jgi:DinB superfamily
MDFKNAIRTSLATSEFFTGAYLGDFSAADMMARAVPGANHVAWQLGHLISAECRLVEAGVPGSMPKLPVGFMEKHTKDTAGSDDPRAFLTKEEYLQLAKEVRSATLATLEKCSDADLEKQVSGRVPPFVKCAGDGFVTVGGHWTLHAGQWAVLRRKLGRPVQF